MEYRKTRSLPFARQTAHNEPQTTTVDRAGKQEQRQRGKSDPDPKSLQHLSCQEQLGRKRDDTDVAVKLSEEDGKGVFGNKRRLCNGFHLPCGHRRNH